MNLKENGKMMRNKQENIYLKQDNNLKEDLNKDKWHLVQCII